VYDAIMGRNVSARGIRITHASGTASGDVSRSRRDLDHDAALAEIRAATTDATELSEAAGQTFFGWLLGGDAEERVRQETWAILIEAGATPDLIERYVTARRERPSDYARTWWTNFG
jgi:hypothetical protein